jgi:predicted nucleotidyltransferase
MPHNHVINRSIVRQVARALGPLNEHAVFVGGAVVCLYVDDPAADDVRPTKDVDLFIEVVSLSGLERLREQLTSIGLRQDPMEAVICRFFLQDIMVDVMSTEPIGWAPGNRWFKDGIGLSQDTDMGEGIRVRCLPFAHFLATKFDAYNDRGKNDPVMSKDFEDIVYLLDNRNTLLEDIRTAPERVRTYLQERCAHLMTPGLQEPILAHLSPFERMERWELLRAKLAAVVG